MTRIGTLMFGTVFLLAASAPAAAEVCDKIAGDAWRPEHGPSMLLGFSFVGSVVIAAALVAMARAGLWIISGLIAAPLLALYLFAFMGHLEDPIIYRAALHEGCRSASGDLISALLMGMVLAASIFFGTRRHRPTQLPKTS